MDTTGFSFETKKSRAREADDQQTTGTSPPRASREVAGGAPTCLVDILTELRRGSPRAWAACHGSPVAEARFALPVAYNDGTPIPVSELAAFCSEMLEVAGGVTLYPAGGICVTDGALELDQHLICEIWLQDPVQLRALLRKWGARFGQRAMWLTLRGGGGAEEVLTDAPASPQASCAQATSIGGPNAFRA